MSAAFKVEISDEPIGLVVHRFRNCGEDIYRQIRDVCSVSLEEIDRSTTSFVIRDVRKRDLGFVSQIINRELRKHGFEETATVSRV